MSLKPAELCVPDHLTLLATKYMTLCLLYKHTIMTTVHTTLSFLKKVIFFQVCTTHVQGCALIGILHVLYMYMCYCI